MEASWELSELESYLSRLKATLVLCLWEGGSPRNPLKMKVIKTANNGINQHLLATNATERTGDILVSLIAVISLGRGMHCVMICKL